MDSITTIEQRFNTVDTRLRELDERLRKDHDILIRMDAKLDSTNTTVTIAVNSDYVIANAAITDNYYSDHFSPEGYPPYFSITPSTSNVTGFSAIDGYVYRYSMVGAAIHVFFQIGGTSNSATFTITLPATVAASAGLVNVPIAVKDNGTWQSAAGVAAANPTSNTLLIGKTIPSLLGGTYAGFTTSGSKFADGDLTFYV